MCATKSPRCCSNIACLPAHPLCSLRSAPLRIAASSACRISLISPIAQLVKDLTFDSVGVGVMGVGVNASPYRTRLRLSCRATRALSPCASASTIPPSAWSIHISPVITVLLLLWLPCCCHLIQLIVARSPTCVRCSASEEHARSQRRLRCHQQALVLPVCRSCVCRRRVVGSSLTHL